MKAAALIGDGHLEIVDRPAPTPGPGQVVMNVAYCGICGTDLHALKGDLVPLGSVLGHEASGLVAAVGPGVDLEPGTPVVVRPSFVCGECVYCLEGDFRLCAEHFRKTIGVGADGAFAEQVLLEDYMAIPLPAGTPLDRAALIEPLACGVLAVRISGVSKGDRAVVIGAGPIGLGIVACLRQATSEIAVFERSPKRREIALELGADIAEELPDDPASHAWLGEGADLVFECAGATVTANAAIEMARPGGTIVVAALYGAPQPIDLSAIVKKALVVRGAIGSRAEDFLRAVDLVARGAIEVERMVTATVALDDIDEAVASLRDPAGAVKVLVAPGPEPTRSREEAR